VANDEHLALLRQGTVIWNEWRRSFPLVTPDLKGANLSDADLRRADLSYADLSGANLSHAILSEAHLFQAILSAARLDRALLPKANLQGANLSDANLVGANFLSAKLDGANLRHSVLGMANFTGAEVGTADLSGALLFQTVFGDVDLSEAVGLGTSIYSAPNVIDFRTLSRSKNLSTSFLRGCGLPDNLIEYLPSLRGAAIQFYSCFISYSAKDQVFAERLHADLQNKGVRCWFAPHHLPIGARTLDAVDEAIRLREKLLVVLSKASLASDWVEDEVSKAYAEERSRKEVVLFPIRIDNTVMSTAEPWAVKLRDQRNIGDFRQWKKPAEYQKSLERLLRDLKASEAG
jgi:uncharacterized protein YjbI with pentapeptide repeats